MAIILFNGIEKKILPVNEYTVFWSIKYKIPYSEKLRAPHFMILFNIIK